MFSFHKPKIYRSNLGCCICKAKSSSSRFTDSKKYENEFEQCFRLNQKRSGEICNACVLLVKRWKKLTPENRLTKHWHHVVDARAGPGTKLSGNRRLTSTNSHQRTSSAPSATSTSTTTSASGNINTLNNTSIESNSISKQKQTTNNMLPLGSNQTNQLGHKGLSRVCAIDTNVSTFTFGEPIVNINRTRSYMSSNNESNYYKATTTTMSASSSSSSPPLSLKPQSALNSSAFESVIKRFRQRQQQQHLEAQRRKMNRQQRAQQQRVATTANACAAAAAGSKSRLNDDNSQVQSAMEQQQQQHQNQNQAAKRAQRYSSTENTFGIGSVLDGSIWRKEKICCGIIFRGLYNEIAIVPRLLKPCQCRMLTTTVVNKSGDVDADAGTQPSGRRQTKKKKKNLINKDSGASENVPLNEEEEAEEEAEVEEGQVEAPEPPARATKSGSISSCDSNTSGCGSMVEEANSGSISSGLSTSRNELVAAAAASTKPRKRRRLDGSNNKQQLNSVQSPSGSSSGNSSSQLNVGDGEEEEEEEEEEQDEEEDILIEQDLVLIEADHASSSESAPITNESSNDDDMTSSSSTSSSSSSVESLTSTDLNNSKQSNAVALG